MSAITKRDIVYPTDLLDMYATGIADRLAGTITGEQP
jgi:hypothetical protein